MRRSDKASDHIGTGLVVCRVERVTAMPFLYFLPAGSFGLTAPRAGTKQAATRPLTLVGPKGDDCFFRVTVTDADRDAIMSADPAERRALAAALPGASALISGRVQIERDAMTDFLAFVESLVTDEERAAIAEPEIAKWRSTRKGSTAEQARTALAAGPHLAAILASGVVPIAQGERSNGAKASGADKTAATIAKLF